MARSRSKTLKLTRDQARTVMVDHHGLRASLGSGPEGIRATLRRLRCIQLDPLDRIGTNADLVALARVDGIRRGEVSNALMPNHGFEHFAKERCIIPDYAFPYYRAQLVENSWWSHSTRLARVPADALAAVFDYIRQHGPCTASQLPDHGKVEALDWSGWKGTSKVATMACEILWARCDIVVAGKRGRERVYDVPSRALPHVHADEPGDTFDRWAIRERAEAAGLLSSLAGAHWSMLADARKGPVLQAMLRSGELASVSIEGSNRVYYAPPDLLDRAHPADDGRMRILGPLDPVLWDRKLVEHIFGFEYLWEVYKPASQRRWGYYVTPLLHQGRFVGRIEAKAKGGDIEVERLWIEEGAAFDDAAYRTALARHAEACGG